MILSLRQLNIRITKADWILFSSLLLLSVCGILLVGEIMPAGATVQIYVNGKPSHVYPLGTDREIPVAGPLGTTYVEIKKNRVRILESPCKTRWCIRQGWQMKGTVICLPNRVMVTIGSQEPATDIDVDAISG